MYFVRVSYSEMRLSGMQALKSDCIFKVYDMF